MQVAPGIVVGTTIIFTAATLIRYTELPGSERDPSLQGMAMIVGYGIVMLGVCMLAWYRHAARVSRIEMTRPLCPYPQIAKYTGTGSTNDALNFVCTTR